MLGSPVWSKDDEPCTLQHEYIYMITSIVFFTKMCLILRISYITIRTTVNEISNHVSRLSKIHLKKCTIKLILPSGAQLLPLRAPTITTAPKLIQINIIMCSNAEKLQVTPATNLSIILTKSRSIIISIIISIITVSHSSYIEDKYILMLFVENILQILHLQLTQTQHLLVTLVLLLISIIDCFIYISLDKTKVLKIKSVC